MKNILKRQLLIGLIAFLNLGLVHGQTEFQKRFGSQFRDNSTRSIQMQDGNFITVGYTQSFGSLGNGFIMKVSSTGHLLWIKDYPGINSDVITDVLELPNQQLVMSGYTSSYGAGSADAFVMKTDSVGNPIWAKTYGGIFADGFEKIIEDGENGFYLSGWSDLEDDQTPVTTISRIDSNGELIWSQRVDDYLIKRQAKMTLSSSGVVLGNYSGINASFALWKFSTEGVLLWSNNYTPTPAGSGLSGLDVVATPTGEIQVTTSLSNINTVAQASDIFVIRLNSSGDLISDKSYGGVYVDLATTIANTNDGGIVLYGNTFSAGNGNEDVSLIKLDASGSVQWATAYGTEWYEEGCSVYQTSDDGFVIDGFTLATGLTYDSTKVYLVKTNSLGKVGCNDVSWTPTMHDQTLVIEQGLPASNMSFSQVSALNWNFNLRHFNETNICSPLSVEAIRARNEIWNIYPNPFSNQTTIQINANMDNCIITICNCLGETVKEIRNVNGQTITLSRDNLSDGIYIVRLISNNRVEASEKLVVTD